MPKILLSITMILFSGIAFSQSGFFPSKTEYTRDELQKLDWIAFPKASPERAAPIAIRVRQDGVPVQSILNLFTEEILVSLPQGQAIEVSSENEKVSWLIPPGTRLAHHIQFKDSQKTDFEFRMLEKSAEGRWKFGVYRMLDGIWKLNQSTESEDLSFQLEMDEGKPAFIELKNVPQKVCANCHMRNALEAVQAPGPCDFHPLNPNLNEAWSKEFYREKGWWPFIKK